MFTNAEPAYVLIVEDDRDIAAYFRQVMELAGYHVAVAANGHRALGMMFNQAPQIVLLDLSLPGMNGADLLLIMKTTPRFSHTRIVVITGYAQMAMELPMEPDLVLEKPVSPEQLTGLVERLCQEGQRIPLPRFFETIAQ